MLDPNSDLRGSWYLLQSNSLPVPFTRRHLHLRTHALSHRISGDHRPPSATATPALSCDGAARRWADLRLPHLLRLLAPTRTHHQALPICRRRRGCECVPVLPTSAPHGGPWWRRRRGPERRAQRAGRRRPRPRRCRGASSALPRTGV